MKKIERIFTLSQETLSPCALLSSHLKMLSAKKKCLILLLPSTTRPNRDVQFLMFSCFIVWKIHDLGEISPFTRAIVERGRKEERKRVCAKAIYFHGMFVALSMLCVTCQICQTFECNGLDITMFHLLSSWWMMKNMLNVNTAKERGRESEMMKLELIQHSICAWFCRGMLMHAGEKSEKTSKCMKKIKSWKGMYT